MDVFVSYQPWFLQIIKPNIQYAIVQYDIQERRNKEKSLQQYWNKLENVMKNPQLRHKTANYEKIIYTSEIQLDAFLSYEDMNIILQWLELNYPIEVLRKPMEGLEELQFHLLRWIRNNERSIFQLDEMNKRGLRRNRNRMGIERNLLSLSMNKSPENIQNAYRRKNNEAAKIRRNYNLKMKHNNYNISVFYKKRHLKTDECAYDFEQRTPEEQQAFLNQIQRNRNNRSNLRYSFKQNWSETIRNLGIHELSFLQTKNPSIFNPEDAFRGQMKKALINLINLYLIPITIEQDDIRTLYCENVMMCISYILYENETKININGKPIKHGLFGQVVPFGNKMYKKESLRVMSESERKKDATISPFKKYPINSYITCQALFGFMIQKYLYNLNSTYIPNIYNINFLFERENPISITEMNNAGKCSYSHSMTFQELLLTSDISECKNFILFIFKIIIKLCDVLMYYQERCFFIHHDLHPDNIFICFNKKSNRSNIIDTEDFKLQLIDFALSSIIIPNHSENLSQLSVTNLKSYWNSKPLNPYFNKNWKQIDLIKFFIFILCKTFMELIKNPNGSNKFPEEHIVKLTEIESLIKILLNMKDLDGITYRDRYSEFTTLQCFFKSKRIDMFLKQRIRLNIFGMNEEDEIIFNPFDCKQKILSTILPIILRNIGI